MYKVDDEPTAFYDVDDTLVMWWSKWSKIRNPKAIKPHHKCVEFIDPRDGKSIFLKPHDKHIQTLKEHKAKKHKIIVWSHGGSDWAEEVIKTLGLEDYVDVVMSKPHWWYDDLEANEVLLPGLKRYINYEDK